MSSPEDLPRGELLEGGSARPPWAEGLSSRRASALRVVLLVLVSGAIGGGTVWWWNDRAPDPVERVPARAAAGVPDVRLVLSGTAVPSAPRRGTAAADPLRINAVLLHDRGPGSATVTRVHRPGNSLSIRASALPVTLSAHHSFQRIRLELSPQDCTLATEWTPSSLPFVVTWTDDRGEVHADPGGDHDASMELTLHRYVDAVCGNPHVR